jgi:hypothetical protein
MADRAQAAPAAQAVRERFSCRQCEAITQPQAPFHVTPRGFASWSLLAMILFEKFGQHQALNRQSERDTREGVELSLSTLADQVGACAAALRPLFALLLAKRMFWPPTGCKGDDTTVPILAKGQTEIGRLWVYVRDDGPFGGKDPPAALFYASRDRTREHPERYLTGWAGILRAGSTATTASSPNSPTSRRTPGASAHHLDKIRIDPGARRRGRPQPKSDALISSQRDVTNALVPRSPPRSRVRVSG